MLLYQAVQRLHRRQRRDRTMDIAMGTVGGKLATQHIKQLTD